jgi:light-regulated signal transduction histidine kinase (bacteriophytochrome)
MIPMAGQFPISTFYGKVDCFRVRRHLIAIVFENLLGNAWNFTAKHPQAQIAVSQENKGNETIFFVQDNGTGFDMAYADKLFAPFQRLHKDSGLHLYFLRNVHYRTVMKFRMSDTKVSKFLEGDAF